MLRALRNRITGISGMKKLTLLLCTVLILTIGFGSTYSYVVTGTPTLFNLFLNGMNPDGDLVIQKTVSHPFGDTYSIPDNLSFTFEVDLGENYAGKIVKTSQGEKTVDENGVITVSVAAGGRTTVYDIDDGTIATVTETNFSKGFTPDVESHEIEIKKYQDNLLTFTNTYVPEKADTSGLTVSGIKTLVGREWIEGDSFTFELAVNNASTWESVGTQTVTYELVEMPDPEDPEKTVLVPKSDFDKFDFTELIRAYDFDTAGTYSFCVSEVEDSIGGLTYDKAESKFDVLVGDADMDGYLEIQSITTTTAANTAIEGTAVTISFENKYAPVGSAEAYIEILKVLEDTSGQNKSPAGFKFELYDEENNLIVTSDPTGSTGETSIRLVYEPTDTGKTFTYVLKETGAGQTVGALIYDDTEYKIHVSVVDNLDGTVSAYVYDWQDPVASWEDVPAKTIGSEGVTENTQHFEAKENTEAPREGAVSGNDAGGTTEDVSVEGIPDETEESENTQASESCDNTVSSGNAGTAETTDTENNGLLIASLTEPVNVPEGATNTYNATFTNRYDPQDATSDISGTKTLSGRNMEDGEFTFLLYQTDKLFTLAEDAQPIDTKVNVSGAFSFDTLTFDKVGTYYYVVTEDASAVLGGVTYDNSRYLVTIVVTDTEGVLTATVSITDVHGEEKDIAFVNSYTAAPVSLPLGGTKILTGAELKDYDFVFELYVADETFTPAVSAFQTTANDDAGLFSFKGLSFTKAGTYRYVVTEDSTEAIEGMVYDDTVYHITVTVADPGDGQLVIEEIHLTADGRPTETILFENSYTEPEESEEPSESGKPSEPTDSSESEKPSESEPTDTGESGEPSESAEPSESVEPSESIDSGEADDPDEPDGSSESDVSEDSTKANDPKTGDDNNVLPYIIALIISGLAAILLLVNYRRRKR